MTELWVGGAVMAGLATFLGIVLAVANRWLTVYEDPRIGAVEGMLPGSNCGACGLPGCRALAEAIDKRIIKRGAFADQSTLTAALIAIAKANPLLRIFLPFGDRPSREVQAQLASALEGRERQAEAEIRAAILTMRGHHAVAVARLAEVKRLEAKVEEIEKRSAAGLQVAEELSRAKLDLFRARGELLKAATDWNISAARLRQAMGLLVRD